MAAALGVAALVLGLVVGPTSASTRSDAPAASGQLTLDGQLALEPYSPGDGSASTATFTVVNEGPSTTIPTLVAGNRDAKSANADFPDTGSVALAPGERYTYRASRKLAAGEYVAWPAYYDGSEWHELAPRTSYDVPEDRGPENPSCTGPFGAGNWPGSCWRRYSAGDSPFYRPLPATAQVARNSAAVVDYLLGGMPGQASPGKVQITVDEAGNSGEPTYYSRRNDPEFTIHCTGSEYHRSSRACPIEGHTVRIPAGAQREGGRQACTFGLQEESVALEHSCLSDRHITVVDQGVNHPNRRWEYDLWRVQTVSVGGQERLIGDGLPASGGTLNIGWGGRVSMRATGLADPAGSEAPPPGDGTAAGWGDLAGRLTAEDLSGPGPINHALFLDVPCVGRDAESGSPYVWPARKRGLLCSELGGDDTNAPPTGALLRLDLSAAQIDALPIDAWKKKILHALADFGGYVGDTGSDQWLEFETESSNQYLVPHGYAPGQDPWWTLASRGGWRPYTTQPGDGTYEPNVRELLGQLDNRSGVDPGIDWKRDVWSHLQLVKPLAPRNECRLVCAVARPS